MNSGQQARSPPLRQALSAMLVAAFGLHGEGASAADDAAMQALQRQLQEVQATLQRLARENLALREHQQELDRKLAELSGGPASAVVAPGTAPPNASALPNASAVPNASALPSIAAPSATAGAQPGATGPGLFGTQLRLWGYGEIYYTNPTRDRNQAQFDLARAVFGIGYQFDPRTEFNSEYELEHAVASSTDVGEFEVEQFYVDRSLNGYLSARGGLFLMPFGFINEHHEPTNFYGVQRNFVETLIIPSTWREGGLSFHGDTPAALTWNVGLTTGFDLSKWQFAPQAPPYANALELEDSDIAPLQATHQELALANGRHLSQYLALGFYGLPGLTLGAALSTGNAVPVPVAANAGPPGNQRVTLWEAHARWAPQRWELQALYARGTISNTALANEAHPGAPNPIPAAFYGYYLQGAYELWHHGDFRLNPFARFERYDMGASYEGTAGEGGPPGAAFLWPQNHDRVRTVGANFYLGSHVVLKTDYQWFEQNTNFNRWDLGLGVAY